MEWLIITASLNALWASVVPNTILFDLARPPSFSHSIRQIFANREMQKQAANSSVVGGLITHKIHRMHLYQINSLTVKKNPVEHQMHLKTFEAYAE